MASDVEAEERAGKNPSEEELKLLASANAQAKDTAGYGRAMEKLVAYYPKQEYWLSVLQNVMTRSGFNERLQIDVARLKLEVGAMRNAAEYLEIAQMSLIEGFPVEATRIVDKGYAAGVLGVGAEAERHKRLRDLALKQDAEAKAKWDADIVQANSEKDGNLMVQLGYAQVSAGQAEAGLKLIEPTAKLVFFAFHASDHGSTSVDEEPSQIRIAAFADAEKS